jgi:hypothetical protein
LLFLPVFGRWAKMKLSLRLLPLIWAMVPLGSAMSQDLAPRAYVVTPVGSNAIILTYSHFNGALEFDGAVPITGATASINMPIASYYHTLDLLGRTANITVAVPYAVGDFRGTVFDAPRYANRAGLLDSFLRFS